MSVSDLPPPPVGEDGFVAVFSWQIVAAVAVGAYPAAACLGCGYATSDRWLPGRTDLPAELPMHPWPDCAGGLMSRWAELLWPGDVAPAAEEVPEGTGSRGAQLSGAYARRARRAAGLDDADA